MGLAGRGQIHKGLAQVLEYHLFFFFFFFFFFPFGLACGTQKFLSQGSNQTSATAIIRATAGIKLDLYPMEPPGNS